MAVPRKFNVGTNTLFVPLMLAMPFVGVTEIIVSVPPGVTTTSFTNTGKVFVVFSVIAYVSGFATGGRFVTLMVMSDELVPPMPSVIV